MHPGCVQNVFFTNNEQVTIRRFVKLFLKFKYIYTCENNYATYIAKTIIRGEVNTYIIYRYWDE